VTELSVGTKKGLFMLEGGSGGEFAVSGRAFAGEPVEYALRDPRSGRLLAAVTNSFYGSKVFYADGVDGEWQQAKGIALPDGGEEALERIWVITPGEEDGLLYAGGDPGVLFTSRDGGESWELNEGLWRHRVEDDWQPGGGGLCLHSIVPWPGEPQRLTVAVSAAGVWHTDDGGQTWRRGNSGLVPRYMPEEARETTTQLCVHSICRSPQQPQRFFMQFHGGVYRSDDAGESWVDIGDGLPSDFGFPLAIDPADPDCAFVIPPIPIASRPAAGCASTRHATVVRAGRPAATACRSRTHTSPSSARRSAATAAATSSSSTSVRRPGNCSAHRTPERPGPPPRSGCRLFSR
jgi:photosystem II stability/assembly factor-like uncharacterized protein